MTELENSVREIKSTRVTASAMFNILEEFEKTKAAKKEQERQDKLKKGNTKVNPMKSVV